MPVPTEDIKVEGPSGQRDLPATLRASFQEVGSDFAESKAP